jgi:hypothetical protein
MKRIAILQLAVMVSACGGGSDDSSSTSAPVAETPMAGTVAGAPWTVMAAETDSFLSDDTSFYVTLYGEAVAACSGAFPDSPSVTFIVPRQAGDYPLGQMYFATFYTPADNNNLIASSGHIVIDSVTDTMLTGGATIEYDANNKLDGKFTINVCP